MPRARSNASPSSAVALAEEEAPKGQNIPAQGNALGSRHPTNPSPEGAAQGWRTVKIGDFAAEVRYGSSSKTKDDADGVPVIRMGNIINGALDFEKLKYLPSEHPEFPLLLLEPGDILFNRTNSAELVGKTAVYRGYPKKCSFASYLIRVRLCEGVPEWVSYYLNSSFGRAWIKTVASQQCGQANVNGSKLKELEIPFPPVEEQRRIVARIEELFSRLDAGVAALRHAKAQLQRYRQSVLAAAVTGQLTQAWREQHPDTEPAADLIARTEAPPRPNRYKSRSKAIQQGHPALSVGNPGTSLPKGWAWAHLVEIARMESGHTPSRNHPEWWDGDIPWIGIADAREHHGTVINDTFQHTNEAGLANSASRLLPAGTVCISRTASVGYVTVMGCAMATSQDFVNWIPTKAVTSEWLRLVFQADTEGLRSFGSGSVHKTIYFPEWLSMHAAIPPLAEQHQIVAEVEARTTSIDHLEADLDRQTVRAARLRQAILMNAFTGGLVDSVTTQFAQIPTSK